jgi:hypothetical protein
MVASELPFGVATHRTEGGLQDSVTLPGTIEPYYEVPIYAQASGHLQSWSTDIGARQGRPEPRGDRDTRLGPETGTGRSGSRGRSRQKIAALTARRWDALVPP